MKPDLSKYKAFLFDLNGTMIDDMSHHINAWYDIVNSRGANLTMEEVKEQCYGKNSDLLDRVFPGKFTEEEKNKIGLEKEQQYQKEYKPKLALIHGLDDFLKKTHEQKIKLAIGSAAIMFNIDFVLDGLHIRKYFDTIVSADDVENSKPDAETYLKCAKHLNINPAECLVFEDAPKGVEAALNAGMDCIVITTMHEKEEFSEYKNVVEFIKNYEELGL